MTQQEASIVRELMEALRLTVDLDATAVRLGEAFNAAHQMMDECKADWISVNDGLPELAKKVLIWKRTEYGGHVVIGYCHLHRVDNQYRWYDQVQPVIGMNIDASHWMPLPAPPVEEAVKKPVVQYDY